MDTMGDGIMVRIIIIGMMAVVGISVGAIGSGTWTKAAAIEGPSSLLLHPSIGRPIDAVKALTRRPGIMIRGIFIRMIPTIHHRRHGWHIVIPTERSRPSRHRIDMVERFSTTSNFAAANIVDACQGGGFGGGPITFFG
jgi:hypothetical protein